MMERTLNRVSSGYRGTTLLSQIAKFMMVGVLNTLIDAGTYFILTRWIAFFAVQLIFAKGIAYAVGMTNSFFWNRSWTFKSQTNPWRAALLFTLTHIAALSINAGVMGLGLNWLSLPEGIALLLATAASFAWNFVLNKLLVFKA